MAILFLIGSRGSGKTAASVLLERDYGCLTRDTDALIRETSGKTVAEVVADGGWSAFRDCEKSALRNAVDSLRDAAGTPAVIATGGGIVLDPDNRDYMRAHGVVAYLAASADVLATRLKPFANDPSRPSLTNLSQEQEIVNVLAERDALYRATAHHIVDAALPLKQVARILRYMVCNGSTGAAS